MWILTIELLVKEIQFIEKGEELEEEEPVGELKRVDIDKLLRDDPEKK